MQEAEPAGSLPGDELGQALPVRQVPGVGKLFVDDLREQLELEARAEDGCVPQQEAVLGRERVHARQDQRLDGVR